MIPIYYKCPQCGKEINDSGAGNLIKEHVSSHEYEIRGIWVADRLAVLAECELPPPGTVTINVQDLLDGVNPPEKILKKIKLGVILYNEGYSVAIQCKAGVSRSGGIATAILSIIKGMDFMDALTIAQRKVPRIMPNPDIIDSIKEAIRMFNQK